MSWVQVGLAIAGAGSSILGGLSAKDDAEKAAEMQAKMIERTAAENKRRREADLRQKMGQMTAAIGASNIQFSGSADRYLRGFESEYRREMAWDAAKARMDARMAEKTGQAMGESALWSGFGNAIGFAGQAYSAWPKGG